MTLDLAAIEARIEAGEHWDKDLPALLAAVRTLEAEREELRRSATEQVRGLEAEVRRLRDNFQRAEARVTALEEALKPFADFHSEAGNSLEDVQVYLSILQRRVSQRTIDCQDFTRAAALLTKEGGL